MKTTFNEDATHCLKLSLAALVMLVLAVLSCKEKGDLKTETDRASEILIENTWNAQTVMVDGTDKTSTYQGLTLSFNKTNYFTTNGGVVWPATGQWKFADQTGKLITRSDGINIIVKEVTTTRLVLQFTWATKTLGGGKVSSNSGEHVFTFKTN